MGWNIKYYKSGYIQEAKFSIGCLGVIVSLMVLFVLVFILTHLTEICIFIMGR